MRIVALFLLFMALSPPLQAAENKPCAGEDKLCLFDMLEQSTTAVTEQSWQESTWREMAKLLTHQGQEARAVSLISRIKSPDTQAMTVRGIGIAAAEDGWIDRARYDALFTHLKAEAAKIADPPSNAIAMNYIADAQALSGDDAGSMETALSMANPEMRNKALYDSAKYQAEGGRLGAALAGIAAMDDPAFRNKAWRAVSKIFADAGDYDNALRAMEPMDNAYQKAQAVLYILTKQIVPEEVSVE